MSATGEALAGRLVLLGAVPALPGASMPVPFRVFLAPSIGRLLQRIPSTPTSVVQFCRTIAHEGETIVKHPELIDLLVAGEHDPVAAATSSARSVHPTADGRRPGCEPTSCGR